MSRETVVRDAAGERRFTAVDYPLAIGCGAEADIRLTADPEEGVLAHLGEAEGGIFLQPADPQVPVVHNGAALDGSVWLQDGDRIALGEARIRCTLTPQRLTLTVIQETPPLQPPAQPPPQAALEAGAQGLPAPEQVRKKHGRRWYTLPLWAGFGMLALAAAFVFLATPVAFHIEPTPDEVDVDDLRPTIELGGRHLMLPGSYVVRAHKTGYRPLEEQITVQTAKHQDLSFQMEKLPGVVTFTTRPVAGARVAVDGEALGTTPLPNVELAAGTHQLEVNAPRYVPILQTLEVEGLGKRQDVALELTPGWAAVSVSSAPTGARVSMGEEVLGITPLVADLMAGIHELAVALDKHDTQRVAVTVVANEPMTVPEIQLRESDAILALTSTPDGSIVTVDGEFKGRTPLDLALRPRHTHALRLTKPGHTPASREIELAPAETRALAVTLTPEYGVVFVTVRPAGAELRVDGRLVGAGNQRLKLTAVPHTLELSKKGYATYRTTVTPRPGVSKTIEVTLQTQAEAKAARTPATITTDGGQVLRLIRPHRIRMGASRREPGRRGNEPLREVDLTRPYYLGVHEVTNVAFRRFRASHSSGGVHGQSLDGPQQPVAKVSWEDAARYLNWLSRKDGLEPAYTEQGESVVAVQPLSTGYRLPTEAEWAFAARSVAGAAPRLFSWSGGFPPRERSGNYADADAAALVPSVLNGYRDGFAASAPVGSFSPNRFGLFDLGGNVAEWCHDYYEALPTAGAAGSVAKDPLGPARGRHHVVRGSSWRHGDIAELRLSYRDYSEKPRDDLGFRVARYAE